MPKDLSALLAKVKKDLGGAARISHIQDVKTPFATRMPSGLDELDVALRGGFPAGSMHQLFGPDGVGKDYISNCVMAQCQERYGDDSNIFWMSFGYRPDRNFMRMAGVKIAYTDEELAFQEIDPKKATKAQRGETVGNIIFIDIDPVKAAKKPAETMLQTVVEFIRSNEFHLGIINELGSGETRHDVDKKLGEEAKMANWSKLMSDFCRKFYNALRKDGDDGEPNSTTLLVINPVRANLNARTARFQEYTQPSGFALKHAKAVDIHLTPGPKIKDEESNPIGKVVRWKIGKGKHGISEGASGSFEFFFYKGADAIRTLGAMAKSLEVLTRRGPYYYLPEEVYGEQIRGGLSGAIELLRQDPELAKKVRNLVLEKAKE